MGGGGGGEPPKLCVQHVTGLRNIILYLTYDRDLY